MSNITSLSRLETPVNRRAISESPLMTDTPDSALSRDIYILCDGAIKKPNSTQRNILASSTNLKTPRNRQAENTDKQPRPEKKIAKKRVLRELSAVDNTPLDLITSKKSQVWLQKLDTNRLAVQWNVPNNIQRNCQDLLLRGEKAEFVLRLYQNVAVGNAEWKTSQRTLEYPIDILRRRCYINLETSGGGKFTAEIGVRSANGRYIFIARSNKCSTPRFTPESTGNAPEYRHATQKKAQIKTPKVFKSKSRINHLNTTDSELPERDIIAESRVSGVYADFLREGPKALRRVNEKIVPSSIAARSEYLEAVKAETKAAKSIAEQYKSRVTLNAKRLDPHNAAEKAFRTGAIQNYPEKPEGYIPSKLTTQDVKDSKVMIASMLNTQGTVAIDVFKKGENKNLQGKGRETVRVKSKKALAQALKESGIREKSELILSGKLEPGRKVRIGGLLIDTEADGSFYVSCSIKNGKLHVPVEEIDVIITE